MFPMSPSGRFARVLVACALIVSLAATTFVGSANAAPLGNSVCSVAVQARETAVHSLFDAWRTAVGDLKSIATGKGAMREVFGAWRDLKEVVAQAKDDMKALSAACRQHDDTTATSASSALDAQLQAIVDKAITDMQAIVDAARKAAAETATAESPKDSTSDAEPEDSTTGADSDEDSSDDHGSKNDNNDQDKDVDNGQRGQHEDEDENDDDNDKAQTTTSPTHKSGEISAKTTNLGKPRTHDEQNRSRERD